MARKFSKDDVLKYVYGELSPAEEGDFVEAMCSSEELFAYYQELTGVQEELGQPDLQPSEFAVNTILNYARETGAPTPKSWLSPWRILGHAAMVIITFGIVGLSVYAYRSHARDREIVIDTSPSWDFSDLSQRLQMARIKAANLSGNRDVLKPVYSNTYQLIRANYKPAPKKVVLLNIE